MESGYILLQGEGFEKCQVDLYRYKICPLGKAEGWGLACGRFW